MTRSPIRGRAFAGAPRRRRGSVVFIVLWTIAIAALIASAAQLIAFRQATVGRLALERVQARWAARGGIESTIAVMSYHTQNPIPGDARAMVLDLDLVADGEFIDTTYKIRHWLDGVEWSGPRDEHARLNINTTNSGMLLTLLDDLTFDVADAITDWMDEDDDISTMGVESDYYISLNPPYEPRNGMLRTLAELELVAGVFPEHLRGEDWNLNGQLDINENDTHITLPYDNQDDRLDAGWSEFLTASSVSGGATMSGLPRIWLRIAEPEDLVTRLLVSDAQARSLIYYGRDEGNTLEGLSGIDLSRVDDAGTPGDTVINPLAEPLTEEQLQAVIDECTILDPLDRIPGRLNLNSVSPELLRRLMEAMGADEYIADEVIYLRQKPEGVTSVYELQEVQGIEPAMFQNLVGMFTTSSNVFTINCRGRSAPATGVEVEIIAVVDRSTLPIRIIEYREQ